MAKTKQVNKASSYHLPPPEKEEIATSFDPLEKRDYSALTHSLLEKGEFRLLHGDESGVAYFDMAAKLDPSNSELFLSQGLALFEYGSHEGKEEGLTLASKCFKKATALDPHSFQAWHLWGNTLYFLGNRKNEPSYYTHALKKYEKAISLADEQPSDVLADLFWDFADLWSKLSHQSGEITDTHYAIKGYERATSYQEDFPAEFWMSFGNVYAQMGNKTNESHFLVKAINCYKHAVSIHMSLYKGWLLLGTTLKTLYSMTHDDDHFSQANECFSAATRLTKNESDVWLEWAHLLIESATISKDEKKLRVAIDKCQQAHRVNRKDSRVTVTWVEALARLGILTEKMEPVHEALNKIDPLIENGDDPEIFYAYGLCYSAMGLYYKDIDSHYQAIETYQAGLSLDRTHDRLWHSIAMSSFQSALLDHDEKSFDRSLHFFERALNLKKTSTYHSHYAICLLKFGELTHDQNIIEHATFHFEEALNLQKNASYLHPDWTYHYAIALDLLAGFLESDSHYIKALDLLNHILMLRPEFPQIHHQLGLTYSHYGELIHEPNLFSRAIHHYRVAREQDKENDQILLDWALTLLNLGDFLENDVASDQYFREAEYKMIQAAKLGNVHAYYALASLYSVIGDLKSSLRFLEKSKTFDALPPLSDLLEDDWLDNVRETEEFKQFIAALTPHPHD